ncbi:MAG TPA: peptide ABC transporter substrate-binding protein [Dehalococcoidia bacterium]|jgi:peptide/nickel transport system substrate-binding protein|nr:peptide ABC transporter substrate-binding protein [Dehalococcoidia bacterium]
MLLVRGRLLYPTILLAGLAVLAAGWFFTTDPGGTSSRDRYIEGVIGRPARINPLFVAQSNTDADLVALVFDGLTRIDSAGRPQPNLAESWEISPDSVAYTFRLRRNIFWHDGASFDAIDVAFTIAQLQAPGFRGSPALAAQWQGVRTTIIDAFTIELRLPAPSASFLTRAAIGIVPEHLLVGLDAGALFDSTFNRAPVGTGPFALVGLTQNAVRLERHTGYHLGIPGLREIELRFFRDHAALLAALRVGEVSAALLVDPPSTTIVATLGRPVVLAPGTPLALAATELPLAGYTVLYLNNQRTPLNDPRLRQALAAAIDVPTLAAGAGIATGSAGDGPIVPGSWAYSPTTWPSVSDAWEFFDDAGWVTTEEGTRSRGDSPLTLQLVTNAEPVREALANLIAQRLSDHGVTVAVTALPSGELVTRLLGPREYELVLFGWETDIDPDPYGAWHTSQIAPPGGNVAGYHDALSDVLLEAARTTIDDAERLDLYGRFTRRFVETVPSIVLHYPSRLYTHPRALRGMFPGLLFEPSDRFRSVHLWKITTPE